MSPSGLSRCNKHSFKQEKSTMLLWTIINLYHDSRIIFSFVKFNRFQIYINNLLFPTWKIIIKILRLNFYLIFYSFLQFNLHNKILNISRLIYSWSVWKRIKWRCRSVKSVQSSSSNLSWNLFTHDGASSRDLDFLSSTCNVAVINKRMVLRFLPR